MTGEQTDAVLAAIEAAVATGPLTVDELTDAVGEHYLKQADGPPLSK